jgi:FAD:protein FMN transferase
MTLYTGSMVRHMARARLAICALLVVLVCMPARAGGIRDVRPLMGTAVELIAEGADEKTLRSATQAAYAEMERLAAMMSHYDPASPVSEINGAAGWRAVQAPPELLEVLLQADRLSRRSNGAFDITVGAIHGWRFGPEDPRIPPPAEIAAQLPKVDYRKLRLDPKDASVFLAERGMRIDLGGIAKIYILEAGRRVLEAGGVPRALVNGGGGDVVAHADESSPPWRVAVRDPREPERLLGLVELRRGGISSSGNYERAFVKDGKRYHHILDPRTGYPAQSLRGVTLVAEQAESVNGLSVALMVMGKLTGKRLLADSPGVDAIIVDRDGELWMSRGMRKRMVALPTPESAPLPR